MISQRATVQTKPSICVTTKGVNMITPSNEQMKLSRKKKIDFDIDESAMNVFNNKIEDIRKVTDTYTEAIVSYCEDLDIDIDEVIPLISPGMKEKMKIEETALRNISSDNTLTIGDIYA